MILLTVVAMASASATPRPAELSNRELGPYDLRIQADSPDEAAGLVAAARAKGASDAQQIVLTPGVLTTKRSAVSVTLELSRADDRLLHSRFRVLDGRPPSGPDGIALTRDVATALGVGVGDRVEYKKRPATVTAVVLNRSNHAARTALVPSGGPVTDMLGDPARTQYSIYLSAGGGDLAGALAVADTFQRQGYGVLTRWSGAEDLAGNDGEFVQMLRRLALASLALSLLLVVVAIGVVSRMLEGDLHTLFLLGVDRRTRSLLAALLGSIAALLTAVVGIGLGVISGAALRPLLERLNSGDWYAARVDAPFLVLATIAVVAAAAGTAFGWSRTSSSVERGSSGPAARPAHRWRRVVTLIAVSGVLSALAAVATGRWTFLLLVAVLVAPGLAIAIWLRVSSYLGKRGTARATAARLLLTSYARDRIDVPAAGSAVAAGLLAFPLAGGLMIAGLTLDDAGNDRPLVPRPAMAVYNGPVTIAAADIDAIAEEAGAARSYRWTLALLPGATSGDLADAWIPALPAEAGKACPTTGGSATGPAAQVLCDEALRGVALGDRAAIEAVLGRPLTSAETGVLAAGGALSLNHALAGGGRMRMLPMSGLSPGVKAAEVEVSAAAVSPAPGTRVSSTVPTVWLSSRFYTDLRAAPAFRPGQLQAAFVFPQAVTPEIEQVLRRAIVRRVEVGSTDEFLVTHLNATRVSLVQRLLDSTFWVALVLAAGAAAYTAIALRQSQRSAEAVLHDLGWTRAAIARWKAVLVGMSTLVGGLAAVAVAALCGVLVVHGETGHAIPASGWLRLLPLAGIPVAAAAIGAALSYRRRNRDTAAWKLGFARE